MQFFSNENRTEFEPEILGVFVKFRFAGKHKGNKNLKSVKTIDNQCLTDFKSGVSGISIEHLIPVLTFLNNL